MRRVKESIRYNIDRMKKQKKKKEEILEFILSVYKGVDENLVKEWFEENY